MAFLFSYVFGLKWKKAKHLQKLFPLKAGGHQHRENISLLRPGARNRRKLRLQTETRHYADFVSSEEGSAPVAQTRATESSAAPTFSHRSMQQHNMKTGQLCMKSCCTRHVKTNSHELFGIPRPTYVSAAFRAISET